MEDKDQMRRLESERADLQARLPAHSVSPSMLIRLEELEEEIDLLRSKLLLKKNEHV